VSIVSQPSCFLAEWYRQDVTSRTVEDIAAVLQTSAAAMRAKGIGVQLLMTLAVPADEVLYVMFAADSADDIVQTCIQAGIPVERLSSDVVLGSAWPPGGSTEAAHATG
jgi:(2Fe-2S) ferredoxin